MTQQQEIFYAFLVYTLSALSSIGVTTAFYLRARKSELLSAFLNVQYLIIVWLLANGLRVAAADLELAWFWAVIQYMSICMFGIIFLDFAYHYQFGERMPLPFRMVGYSVSGINYVIVFTNPLHQLFFRSFGRFRMEMGPFFYIHTIWSYLLIGIAFVFLIQALFSNSEGMNRKQSIIFSIGLTLPLITNVFTVTRSANIPFDMTPIAFNITILVFGYSAYRYRFLDIKKVTRHMVLDNIPEGILIIDADNRLLLANPVIQQRISNFQQLGSVSDFFEFLQKIENYIPDADLIYDKLRLCIDRDLGNMRTDLSMSVSGKPRNYDLRMERLSDSSGDRIGYLIRLIDITRQKELLNSVEEKNEALAGINQKLSENISTEKKLAKARERSRISKEIHDILGHTMTMVITLLEIAKSSTVEDKDLAKEKTVQAMEIIRSGLRELKEAMRRHDKSMVDARALNEDLTKLMEDFQQSGVNVDYYLKESDAKLDTEVFDTIYRVCQEGLTNALRHGKAENITVGLRYVEKHIDLFIVDDGKGCDKVVKGNGLKGMENRVSSLSGYFSVGSPEGDGFNIHVTLPYVKGI